MMRKRMIAGCMAAGLLVPAVGRGADLSPAEVLAKVKEATGGAAWDGIKSLHFELTVATSGLSGTAGSWTDVTTGHYMDTYQLGPVSGADGYDGETVWSKDTSGQVRPEEGGDERLGAVNEAYRRCLGYWYPERHGAAMEDQSTQEEDGRTFRVLSVTPDGGRPYTIWVDTGTWLFDRTVEKTAMEVRTTYLSDYREVDGVRIPYASRSTNGEERYDVHTTITSVEVNPDLAEGLFAMPAPPPPDFSFSGDRTSTTVPFTLINNHIYVDVTLNGKGPYRLLCDTGGANVITPTLAKELELKPEGAMQGRGVGEKSVDVGMVKMASLGVGDATLNDQIFAVFALESFSDIEGVPIYGLIGYEVFKRFVVHIDYEQSRLTLTLPSAYVAQGNGTVVPFKFNGHIPQVEGSIDGVAGKFDLDTGSRATLDLFGPFVEKNDLESHLKKGPECVTGWGVGGPARSMLTRAEVLKLGPVELHDVVTEVTRQEKGAFTDPYVAGNVGAGVLKRFNLTFDYQGQTVVFEPNANHDAPDVWDRSGMWVNRAQDALAVMDVTEGGPAAKAGLVAGDRILAVDGVKAVEVSLPDLRLRFRTEAPGTEIRLQVEHDGKTREVTLVLQDLV